MSVLGKALTVAWKCLLQFLKGANRKVESMLYDDLC